MPGNKLEDLPRKLGLLDATTTVIGTMIGGGIFIIPAAIAHSLYNVLVFSPIGPPLAGKNVLRVALWAGLAYVLFRYWPVPSETRSETVTTAESPETATGDPCGTLEAGSES